MNWKSVFQEGDQTYSFGRVGAFLIIVVSQAMVGVALAKALAEPKIEWDAVGMFVSRVYESTAWLVAGLYGIAKTSSVAKTIRAASDPPKSPQDQTIEDVQNDKLPK
jgi:hypothetical protein